MVAASRHAFPPPRPADLLVRAAEHHRRGDWRQAEDAYRRLCALEPRNIHALHLHGLLLTQTGRLEAGVALIDSALKLKPDFVEALNTRGNALQALQRLDEALATYDRALKLKPRFADALINRGVVLKMLERHDEALQAFDRALGVAPGSAEAHQNRGATLRALEREDEALAAYDRALAIRPAYFDAVFNRGNALQALGRFEQALAAYDSALALDPRAVMALHNRGLVLGRLERLEDAREAYTRRLAIEPEHAQSRLERGFVSLRLGDYPAGWADYEYRLRVEDRPWVAAEIDAPVWRGEPIAGKSILVSDEQGLGDALHFCRYLTPLAARGAEVTFVVRGALATLMRMSFPALRVMSRPPADESFDFQCPLMSLPQAFRTTLETIPSASAYVATDPARVEKWRDRIGGDGFRIGIAWRGSAASRRLGRSFPLAELAPLAEVPNVRLISLQKNQGVEELDDLPAGMKVETLGEDYEPGGDFFLDAGAIMQSLDLVVSLDSSLAHLAGALARPAWIALSDPAEWRWLKHRADSPWYPSLRLFRQPAPGDWGGAIAQMAAALRELLARG